MNQTYEICQVPTYKTKYDISKKNVKTIDTISAILENDLQFHERLFKNDLLKLSVDVDKLTEKNENATLEKIFEDICEYVGVSMNDISYTTNFSVKSGSHHIVIPKYFMNSIDQKMFWKEFREKYNYGKEIDADIFGKDGWFRLPNQTKEGVEGTEHIIQKGEIEDFVLKYIEKSQQRDYIQKISLPSMTKKDDTTDEDEMSEISFCITEGTDIEFLLNECIKDNCCKTGDHSDWIKIGQIIKNELKEEGVTLFVNWTNKFGNEQKKKEAFEKYTKHIKFTPLNRKERLTIGTLKLLAKKYNLNAYNLRFPQKQIQYEINEDIEEISKTQSEYAYAKYFCKLYGKKFKCIDISRKLYYKFNDKNLWEEENGQSSIRELISNDFHKIFENYKHVLYNFIENQDLQEEESVSFKSKLKCVSELSLRLFKTNDKNNITREISDIVFDEHFTKDMNREKFVLPLKNLKMLNVKTLEVYDRTPLHKFNYECDANFINLSLEQENDINQYFLDLFCQKQDMVDTVIDIFKSIFSGRKLRYIFFFTGAGCNGKSLLFKILNKIFSRSMNTIATNVILDLKQNNAITTEFEKLDKCLLGYVTELKETDKLNEKVIKQISGGDAIDLRALFKTNVTIEPTCNLCVLTNELPTFTKEKAIVDRIITIPFLNTFGVDDTFEDKLMAKKDEIFSYIMKRGNILDKFNLTEDMISAKNEYVEKNEIIDHLEDFIKDKFDVVPFVKNEKIVNNVFVSMYLEWLQMYKRKDDKTTNKHITRRVKKFGINEKPSNGKHFYTGLVLKEDIDEDEE